MLLLERQKLDRGETVTINDHRSIALLEELVAYSVKVGGHVDVAFPLRPSQAKRLTAIAGGRQLTLRHVSRVVLM
jgi:hypothetical protein